MPGNTTSPSLQGCRIALPLTPDAPASPVDELRTREAAIFFYPVAQLLPPTTDEIDAALDHFVRGDVEWMLLTTPHAVEAMSDHLTRRRIKPTTLSKRKLAVFGAHAQQMAAQTFPKLQNRVPAASSHEEFVRALSLAAGDTVLLPQAQHSRSDWEGLLTERDVEVLAPPAYRLILGRGGDDLPALLWGGLVDALVLLSEDNVRHFVTRLKHDGGSLDMLNDVVVACLDEPTAAAALIFGLRRQIIADQPTSRALADALAHWFTVEPVHV